MMGGKITKKRVREKKNEKEIALFCVGTEIRKGKGNLSFFFFFIKGKRKNRNVVLPHITFVRER